jgi:hypothetical protein
MRDETKNLTSHFTPHSSSRLPLFGLFVVRVLAATATELAELKPLGRSLLVLGCHVVAALACGALEHNVIARHNSPSQNLNLLSHPVEAYSTTSETVPAPTVRPPSLMANLNPFSIAIGAINSISIATLSPGITISTPSGSFATPVTSVVLK